MDLAVQDYGNRIPKDYGGYQPGLITRDERDPLYSTTGIYGDATLATPEKGKRAVEILTNEFLKAIDGFSQVPGRSAE
jgi:creatinine amidohydrolase/Fe(II)-dependent formamide hydrolase-like protein